MSHTGDKTSPSDCSKDLNTAGRLENHPKMLVFMKGHISIYLNRQIRNTTALFLDYNLGTEVGLEAARGNK